MKNIGSRFFALVQAMAPGNFAMVMSTGIISVALSRLGCPWGAWLFHGVNAVVYAVLWGLLLLRVIRYPRSVAADFGSHFRGPTFLTIVAGTCIFGTQCAALAHSPGVASTLFWLGAVGWACLLWGIFFAIFTRLPKPALSCGINGAWLLATVSTEALVTLGATLGAPPGWDAELVYFCLCALFSLGVVLYLLVITAIFLRFSSADMKAADLDPTYWINASAAGAAALAGTALMSHAGASHVLDLCLPYVTGITLLAWATASWWVPTLILLGIWRHCIQRYPFAYTPAFWSIVFPLGMYTASTAALAVTFEVPRLMAVPRVFIVVSLAAWAATLGGLARSRGRALFKGARLPARRKC